jgi:hypothetical protein
MYVFRSFSAAIKNCASFSLGISRLHLRRQYFVNGSDVTRRNVKRNLINDCKSATKVTSLQATFVLSGNNSNMC